jgi:tetrahydromethanopterin S-methyltransferase subunit G
MEKVYYGQHVMTKERFTAKQQYRLDKIEKKLDNIEKKLDKHIEDIWTVYEPIKKILKVFTR